MIISITENNSLFQNLEHNGSANVEMKKNKC